jgi:hypothetical protein
LKQVSTDTAARACDAESTATWMKICSAGT